MNDEKADRIIALLEQICGTLQEIHAGEQYRAVDMLYQRTARLESRFNAYIDGVAEISTKFLNSLGSTASSRKP